MKMSDNKERELFGVEKRGFIVIYSTILLLGFVVIFWYIDTTQQRLTKEKTLAVVYAQNLATQYDKLFTGIERYNKCKCSDQNDKSCASVKSLSLDAIEEFLSKRTENTVSAAANFGTTSKIFLTMSKVPDELTNIHKNFETIGVDLCDKAQQDVRILRGTIEEMLVNSIQ